MITGNLILSTFLIVSIIGTSIIAYLSYSRHKKNLYVSDELDILIHRTLETIEKQKAMADVGSTSGPNVLNGTDHPLNLDSPAVVATILNVLVSKFGDVRLSLQDFVIADESYVSIYVDGQSQEIILSMNPNLSQEELYSMGSYVDPNDNTFH
tara:strand:+ start:1379 stop:1837 length:459 start_codon:yes stop_codon:yes gene_type:complete